MTAKLPQTEELWSRILNSIRDHWQPLRWRGVGVVIGCSGGADSTALARALAELRNPTAESADLTQVPAGFLVLAHMNHRLRGAESDGDEAFVSELASQFGAQFVCSRDHGDVRDEATLRERRLNFLTDVAHQTGSRYVAMAHHRDDQVETVLHHLLRGTGPTGMAGISGFRNLGSDLVLARPMIGLSRESIQSGLSEIGQSWREDSSNSDQRYRRNWIRKNLIPTIESEFPTAADSINRLSRTLAEWTEVMDQIADDWIEHHVRVRTDVSSTGVCQICEVSVAHRTKPVVIAHAMQRLWRKLQWPRSAMTQTHWKRLTSAVRGDVSPVQQFFLPGQVAVIGQETWLVTHKGTFDHQENANTKKLLLIRTKAT